MARHLTYTIHLQPLPEGGYFVTVPALPGCMTQADTYEQAVEMAKEAIEGYIAVLLEDGDPIPMESEPPTTVAVGVRVDLPQAM
jgi:antitoxin HicB